jgi:hypothetical protein
MQTWHDRHPHSPQYLGFKKLAAADCIDISAGSPACRAQTLSLLKHSLTVDVCRVLTVLRLPAQQANRFSSLYFLPSLTLRSF